MWLLRTFWTPKRYYLHLCLHLFIQGYVFLSEYIFRSSPVTNVIRLAHEIWTISLNVTILQITNSTNSCQQGILTNTQTYSYIHQHQHNTTTLSYIEFPYRLGVCSLPVRVKILRSQDSNNTLANRACDMAREPHHALRVADIWCRRSPRAGHRVCAFCHRYSRERNRSLFVGSSSTRFSNCTLFSWFYYIDIFQRTHIWNFPI